MPYIETLSTSDIDFGNRLWEAIRGERSLSASGALWLYAPDSGEWHLLIATPLVDQIGARDTYRKLADLTENISADTHQLLRIEVVSPKNPLYAALKAVFGQTASVHGTRLSHSQVQGIYVEDAYLYEIR